MSIQNKIKVNTYYTRSINLERDADSLEVIKTYIPTSRALRTFSQIADTFNKRQNPRAWSLVGPYGSGKSSFSVFLSQLLSNSTKQSTKIAQKILHKTDKKLAAPFIKAVDNSEGYLKILITGSPEPMSKCIVKGMYLAALKYWNQQTRKNNAIVTCLKKATNKNEYSVSEILNLIKKLQSALAKTNCAGILLIVDELGKFLEYETRHYGANDIFLLQALAEHACKGNKVNLLLFVLLHQSFEQYAKGLDESLKKEWSKVQGRFEKIPFLESAEQVLRVVSEAFTYSFTRAEKYTIRKSVDDTLNVLIKNEALPNVMTDKEASNLFVACYPLHPVSAILLPLLCQKVAQNERTLFSYLGSHEDFGLQNMLDKLSKVGEFIYPHHIYDYFISNQPAVMSDYITHHRWAEVITAIERLGNADDNEVNLLKTIGVLNIIGSKGGFKASKEILTKCAINKSKYSKAIKALLDKSIVTMRVFNNEYRVWQGSDFDLEEALQKEKANLGQFSVVTELNHLKKMSPIIARKYTIQNGALRYFVPLFIDARSYLDNEPKSKEARIIFYLGAGQDDEKVFTRKVIKYFSKLDIVILCLNGSQLQQAVAETVALKRIQVNYQALNSDQIAIREFQDRLTSAELSVDRILVDLLDCPEKNHWFNDQKKLTILSKRALQQNLSSILEKIYNKAPTINNELINRDKLSAQGNGARNKLLLAMLNNAHKEDLAIEKFPAEKAIYRSLLLETGLHRKVNNGWKFKEPNRQQDQYKMRYVWRRIDRFLERTEKAPSAFIELNETLMSPPYGIKAGSLPILYIAAYLCYQHEIAIYDNRSYKPYFTNEMLARFIKRPNEFTFQRFRIKGLRASIFKQYSKVIETSKVKTNTKNLLDLARPLATFMGSLPEYTQKTRNLKDNTIAVRTAFNLAKSPKNLLFNELPEALGFKDLATEKDEENISYFSQALTKSLEELKNAYAKLIDKQKELLANAFNITMDEQTDLSKLRKALNHYCFGLENYTIDTKGLRAFIMRINKETGSDKDWLENLLMFLSYKPSNKWLDSDRDAAEYRLMTFSRSVIDLKKLQVHETDKATKRDDDFDIYLLSSVKKGVGVSDKIISVDRNDKKGIADIKERITEYLSKLPDNNLVWATLAEIIDASLRDDLNIKQDKINAKQYEFDLIDNQKLLDDKGK